MCYYIGIEDLAANALIEILQSKEDKGHECRVTLEELEAYGAEVVRYMNERTDEKVFLILSRASTTHMFKNYSDFFEEVETDKGTAIALQKGKTVEDLIRRFRTYLALELIQAFEKTVSVLYEGNRQQKN